MTIVEPTHTLNQISPPGTINDLPVEILLDNKACRNYVSEKIAKTSHASITATEPKFTVDVVNGEKVPVTQQITVDLQIQQFPNTKFPTKLYLLPGLKNHVNLGLEFLLKNEATIDLKQGILRLSEHEIEIPNFILNHFQESRDKLILDKVNQFLRVTLITKKKI